MRKITCVVLILGLCLIAQRESMAQGVWTPVVTPNPSGSSGVPILLSDGSVMVCAANTFGESNVWTKLTPDSQGNYINGTWTTLARMNVQRLFFAANVLPSGKVFVMGGEYSSEGSITNSGEIYDPVANTWTRIAPFPHAAFGDDPTVVLPSGKILCGYIFSGQTYLYDPVANTWTPSGTKVGNDRSDEESWSLLPDGGVLSYNIFTSPSTGPGSAQRYNASTGQWTATGPVPVPLTSAAFGFELGPSLLLPDGRVFQIGANNQTVLYSPSTNSWTTGPSLPTNMGCDDAPGAMLPNGKVLFIADHSSPTIFTGPSRVFLFDPTTNSLSDATPTGAAGTLFAQNASYVFTLLMLPNGHMLMTTPNATVWDYAPAGSPNASWAPTISSVAQVNKSTWRVTGTQLNGISEGTSFGDDIENSTNYPIVSLKYPTGTFKYLRTTNWAPGVVASGSRQLTVDFELPTGLLNGVYQVKVIANGIPSAPHSLVIGPPAVPSNVIATYASATKTLTLTGDAKANVLTVSLQAGNLKVEGANGTTINNGASFQTQHSGKLIIVANLNDGDDSIAVIGVDSSTSTINLGNGNDNAAMTLSNFGTLNIDGGPGINTYIKTSSTVTTLNKKNFQ